MIFKKCITVLLTILLLVSNSGLSFNVHYCGNKIASISLRTNKNATAMEQNCCGIVEKQSNCCNDKSFKLLESSDKFKENIISIDFYCSNVIAGQITFSAKQVTNFKNITITNGYSSVSIKIPIFKRNCQLVLYA